MIKGKIKNFEHGTINQEITIYTYINDFKNALEQGWKRLQVSESRRVYEEAFNFFHSAGLYEGLFRPHIPNPVYDNAAKDMGHEFLEFATAHGIYFSELFPGDFAISTESEANGKEYRVFYLTAHHAQTRLGMYKLKFEHTHDRFEFLSAPDIEVEHEH